MNIAIEQSVESSFYATEMEIDYVRVYEASSLSNEIEPITGSFKLNQNYPNPFNSSTNIFFSIPNRNHLKLYIYDVSGSKIIELFNNYKSAGTHSIGWNGKNERGVKVSAGIYLYSIDVGEFRQTKKMIFLK